MNSINYLKLDFRLIRGELRYYGFVPLIAILFILKSPIIGMGYLFFFLMIVATVPFNGQNIENCERMYYMFPSKTSSMVLGRFLYLLSAIIIVWIIDVSVIMYHYNTNTISILEVGIICLSGIVATIFCFVQYPLYYKFGIGKGKILSMILFMVPAFIVFALPSMLKNNGILSPEFLYRLSAVTMRNKIILPLLIIVIIGILGIVSYLFSCLICERKEI